MPRKWGQHFLVSKTTQRKIVDACGIEEGDEVLEIGPGQGELTQHYFDKVRRVVLVEIDPRLAQNLKDLWGHLPQFEIVNADFRNLDPDSLGFSKPPVILSDLPYYASKPLLRQILQWKFYRLAVLTFQKEVALRVIAKQGDDHYGALSLLSQLYAASEMVLDLPPHEFNPRPKVASTVIRVRPIESPLDKAELNRLEKFIKLSFAQSRKTLANNIANGIPSASKNKVEGILKELSLSPLIRPHQIGLPIFQFLAKALMGTEGQNGERLKSQKDVGLLNYEVWDSEDVL